MYILVKLIHIAYSKITNIESVLLIAVKTCTCMAFYVWPNFDEGGQRGCKVSRERERKIHRDPIVL